MEDYYTQNSSIAYCEPSVPFFFSGYVLDSIKRGALFKIDTYTIENVLGWTLNLTSRVVEGVPLPEGFNRYTVNKIFLEKITKGLSDSKFKKLLDDIDSDKPKSLKQFLAENHDKGVASLLEIEKTFRSPDFPPYMWMEFSRFSIAFSETSKYLEGIVEGMFLFKPLRPSQASWKNKVTKARTLPYESLINGYFKSFFAFLKLLMFLEVWSCEKETDLFTEKTVWTLKNVKPQIFEELIIEFHNAISELRQAFMRFKREKSEFDFSKPTDWAFKQLMIMA